MNLAPKMYSGDDIVFLCQSNEPNGDYLISQAFQLEIVALASPCQFLSFTRTGQIPNFNFQIKTEAFTEILYTSVIATTNEPTSCPIEKYSLVNDDGSDYVGSMFTINEVSGHLSAQIAPGILSESAKIKFCNLYTPQCETTNQFTLQTECGPDSTEFSAP